MVDLVLHGGPVFTADAVRSRPTAVAVDAGRVVAVGHDEVLDLAGPRTERVDLRGRLLVPGFQDAHVHPVWAGLHLLRCDLAELDTAPAYLEAIGSYARANPDLPWVLGSGWSMPAFPGGTPTAAALDTVVPDRPAYLTNADSHGAWVNSAALRLAGIDAATPDPADGRIERDADGTPTGTLHEGAMRLVGALAPTPTDDDLLEALLLAQSRLHALGVTGWQDAIVGDYGDGTDPAVAYRAAVARDALTARVVGALWWDRTRGLEQVDELVARRDELSLGRFVATSVKIMQDGVAENFTASMSEPYCDGHGHPTDNSGISFVPPEVLDPAAAALDAHGFQLHFHAIGDLAVRQCLDAVEHAIARNGRRDARHHIAHLQVVHPDDVPRFRELGVVANLQMLWAALEAQMVELTLPFLGEPRGVVAVPVRRPAPLRRDARRGVGLVGLEPRPARRPARRGQPHGARGDARGRRRAPGLPARAAARPRHGADRLHGRLGPREPARRLRHHPPRCARRPRRARPRPVRRPARGDRRHPGAADLRRRPPGARRSRRLTRTASEAGEPA